MPRTFAHATPEPTAHDHHHHDDDPPIGDAGPGPSAEFFTVDDNPNDADQGVDALLSGRAWGETIITVSYPDSTGDYTNDDGSSYWLDQYLTSYERLNPQQMAAMDRVMDGVASFTNLQFEVLGDDPGENDADAIIMVGETSSSNVSTALGYYPGEFGNVDGDIWLNKSAYNEPVVGNYQWHIFVHEFGHALGLKHGHETWGPGAIPFEQDSHEYSNMTYRSYTGAGTDFVSNASDGYAQSFMMLDIAALQYMYGANFEHNGGDTVYTFSTQTGVMFVNGISEYQGSSLDKNGDTVFRTIWDGNGVDTYDFANYTTDISVDLAPGGYVDLDTNGNFQRANLGAWVDPGNPFTYARGHVYNALLFEEDLRSLIENANGGSGDDVFYGNQADNTFVGNGGNDTFHDSIGADIYIGGAGNDAVNFAGQFNAYAFTVVDSYLQVAGGEVVDLVSDSVETVYFADESRSVADLMGAAEEPEPEPNTPPVAVDDEVEVAQDGLSDGNLLANDGDEDEDDLSVIAVNGNPGAVDEPITLESGALLAVNADGTFVYDPNGAFDPPFGETETDSFTYTITDGQGGTDSATVEVVIAGNPPEEEPPVEPVTMRLLLVDAETDEIILELGPENVIDPAAVQGLAVSVVAEIVTGGELVESVTFDLNDGAFTKTENFVPYALYGDANGDYHGQEIPEGPHILEVTAHSENNGGGEILATLTVSFEITDLPEEDPQPEPNTPPVAIDDEVEVAQDGLTDGNLLANDSDEDEDDLSVAALNGDAEKIGQQVTLESGALLTVNEDGTFVYDPNGAFDPPFGETETDSFTYTVTDGNSGTDSATVEVVIVGSDVEPNPTVVGINANGDAYATEGDFLYMADQYFDGGRTFSRNAEIAGTDDDALYQSERFGQFSYSVPLEPGEYLVTLQFAEIYFNEAGKRIFDVSAEGELVLDDFDIWATAGGKNIAHDVILPVSVTDGALDLDFTKVVNNAKISAIRIEPLTEGPVPNFGDVFSAESDGFFDDVNKVPSDAGETDGPGGGSGDRSLGSDRDFGHDFSSADFVRDLLARLDLETANDSDFGV